MITLAPLDALERLRLGNLRFVDGNQAPTPVLDQAQRTALSERHEPFAVILGCSDARVPVELVFDQGLGDLFVIRVAGNVVASSQIGSVEFAVDRFGVRLVVVLGHTHCGAIRATIEQLTNPDIKPSRALRSIVDRVSPAVESLLATDLKHNEAALVHEAVRSNVRISTNALRHGSDLLERMVDQNELLIVGAEYSLDNGLVDFFDHA